MNILDREFRKKIDAKNKLEQFMNNISSSIDDEDLMFSKEQIWEVKALLKRVQKWFDQENELTKE